MYWNGTRNSFTHHFFRIYFHVKIEASSEIFWVHRLEMKQCYEEGALSCVYMFEICTDCSIFMFRACRYRHLRVKQEQQLVVLNKESEVPILTHILAKTCSLWFIGVCRLRNLHTNTLFIIEQLRSMIRDSEGVITQNYLFAPLGIAKPICLATEASNSVDEQEGNNPKPEEPRRYWQ